MQTFGITEIQFGDGIYRYQELSIVDECDKKYSMINTGYFYETNDTYADTLYVNTAPKGCTNFFRVLDYEIFAPA